MVLTNLAWKIIWGMGISSVSAISSYFIWDSQINTGLTQYDKNLLDQVQQFSSSNPRGDDESEEEETSSGTNLSLATSVNKEDKIIKFNLGFSWDDDTESSEMKTWECNIQWKIKDNFDDLKGWNFKDEELEKLKSPFGIDFSKKNAVDKPQKDAISKFIRACAYWGKRDIKLDKNKTLSRTINWDMKKGPDNKLLFSKISKFL